jgi:hypothetical protein
MIERAYCHGADVGATVSRSQQWVNSGVQGALLADHIAAVGKMVHHGAT